MCMRLMQAKVLANMLCMHMTYAHMSLYINIMYNYVVIIQHNNDNAILMIFKDLFIDIAHEWYLNDGNRVDIILNYHFISFQRCLKRCLKFTVFVKCL